MSCFIHTVFVYVHTTEEYSEKKKINSCCSEEEQQQKYITSLMRLFFFIRNEQNFPCSLLAEVPFFLFTVYIGSSIQNLGHHLIKL